MNTNTHTQPAPALPAHLAAGYYTWHRAGVGVGVRVAAGTATGTLVLSNGSTLPVPAEEAVPALVKALREVEVRYTAPSAPAPAPAPTLTRQRARAMHKELARLGLPADARYALAAEQTGRDVQSLTALTEEESRRVWLAACAQAQAAAELDAATHAAMSAAELDAAAEEWLR